MSETACLLCEGDHSTMLQPVASSPAKFVYRYIVATLNGPVPYDVFSIAQFKTLVEAQACVDGVCLCELDDFFVLIWDREAEALDASDAHASSSDDDEYDIENRGSMIEALQRYLADAGPID